jgi:hypothetical protein
MGGTAAPVTRVYAGPLRGAALLSLRMAPYTRTLCAFAGTGAAVVCAGRAHLRLLMKQRLGKRSLHEQTVPTAAEVRSTPEPQGRGRIPRTHDGLVLCFDQFTLSGRRLVNASSNVAGRTLRTAWASSSAPSPLSYSPEPSRA